MSVPISLQYYKMIIIGIYKLLLSTALKLK